MIEAHGLGKTFDDVVALEALDLQVEAGEVFCLLGANGAGKTTTIHLLLGFLEPTSGRVSIGGVDVESNPTRAREKLAYVPERVELYGLLTGLENARYFATLAGNDGSDDELLDWLGRVGLDRSAAARRVATYSKGMRQKVALAVALARGAKALLLDEPTSGLDPQASNELSSLLRALTEDGVAVLMATHDLFRAKGVGDRVGIMKRGRLVDTRDTASLGHEELESIYLEHIRA